MTLPDEIYVGQFNDLGHAFCSTKETLAWTNKYVRADAAPKVDRIEDALKNRDYWRSTALKLEHEAREINVDRLIAEIRNLPTQEVRIGGQNFLYINREEVLGWIADTLTPKHAEEENKG